MFFVVIVNVILKSAMLCHNAKSVMVCVIQLSAIMLSGIMFSGPISCHFDDYCYAVSL